MNNNNNEMSLITKYLTLQITNIKRQIKDDDNRILKNVKDPKILSDTERSILTKSLDTLVSERKKLYDLTLSAKLDYQRKKTENILADLKSESVKSLYKPTTFTFTKLSELSFRDFPIKKNKRRK